MSTLVPNARTTSPVSLLMHVDVIGEPQHGCEVCLTIVLQNLRSLRSALNCALQRILLDWIWHLRVCAFGDIEMAQ